ncbi:MAG: nicotinamidase [Bacteriovoracaceae bacterium]|nr:nicotinamidase [Bacteriovoracaceae bacterium]
MKLADLAKDKTAALIVIDQQIDFEPGGALAVAGGDEIVLGISKLMNEFQNVILTQDSHPKGHISFASSYEGKKPFELLTLKEVEAGSIRSKFSNELLVNYLKRVPHQLQVLWPDHCVTETNGWKINPNLPIEKASFILKKGMRLECDSYSAFFENDGTPTGLSKILREKKINKVVLVGLAGDYCVYWSAEDAHKEVFEVIYLQNLTRFVNFPENSKEKALTHLREIGVQVD